MRTWILPESLNLDALLVDDEPKRKAPVVPAANAGPGRSMGRGWWAAVEVTPIMDMAEAVASRYKTCIIVHFYFHLEFSPSS
jgi:hypothetical protein